MTLKENLHATCIDFINKNLNICNNQINKIEQALLSETKSTAGDKHETGRAMLHLEREKLGTQLNNNKKLKETLSKINLSKTSKVVCLGSIVYTSQNNYFIAISAGKLKIDSQTFYAISPNTPIGKLLLGKTSGNTITFREQQFVIHNIL